MQPASPPLGSKSKSRKQGRDDLLNWSDYTMVRDYSKRVEMTGRVNLRHCRLHTEQGAWINLIMKYRTLEQS